MQSSTDEAEADGDSQIDQHAASIELDADAPAGEVEPNDEMTAAGYDEAVAHGSPFSAEPNIRAENSADPVALTEADPMTVDELVLQEPGRDLRPDVVTPAPDLPAGVDLESVKAAVEDEASSAAQEFFAPSPDELAATDESGKEEKR